MKKFITPQYQFAPGISGVGNVTIMLDDFDIKKLVAIINVTESTIIYLPTSTAKGLNSVINNQVILNFDTSSHSSSDILQIIYEDDEDSKTLEGVLYFLTSILEKMPRLDTLDRSVAFVEAGSIAVSSLPTLSTVTTVTTVSTVTNVGNINNFSGGNAAYVPFHTSNIGALHIYNQIQFT